MSHTRGSLSSNCRDRETERATSCYGNVSSSNNVTGFHNTHCWIHKRVFSIIKLFSASPILFIILSSFFLKHILRSSSFAINIFFQNDHLKCVLAWYWKSMLRSHLIGGICLAIRVEPADGTTRHQISWKSVQPVWNLSVSLVAIWFHSDFFSCPFLNWNHRSWWRRFVN